MVIGLEEVGFSGLAGGGGGGRKNMDAWIWDNRGPEAVPESSQINISCSDNSVNVCTPILVCQ